MAIDFNKTEQLTSYNANVYTLHTHYQSPKCDG
jgi:hypothetical protein